MDKKSAEQLKKIIKIAKKDKEIIAVALFGSSLDREGRDIDICLFLNEKKSNLCMSKKRLEYLKEVGKKFDIQIFQHLPIYIRARILKKSKILLSKDENRLYNIAFDTIKEFSLFEKIYVNYLNTIENGQAENFVKN